MFVKILITERLMLMMLLYMFVRNVVTIRVQLLDVMVLMIM